MPFYHWVIQTFCSITSSLPLNPNASSTDRIERIMTMNNASMRTRNSSSSNFGKLHLKDLWVLFVTQLTGNMVAGACRHVAPIRCCFIPCFGRWSSPWGGEKWAQFHRLSPPSGVDGSKITTVKDPVMISPEFFPEQNSICLFSTFPTYSLVEERAYTCLFLFKSTPTKTRLHSDNQEKLQSNKLIYSECYLQPGYTLITFILVQILLLGYM